MKTILLILLIFASHSVICQSFIGKSKDKLMVSVPKEMPGFSHNAFGKSSGLNSVKFTDSKKDRTMIFFFDDKNICTYFKMIEDAESYNKRVTEYNTKYKFVSKNNWTSLIDGKNYKISIDLGEYIFTTIYSL